MSYIRHMDTDLMGTTGFERYFDEAELLSFVLKYFLHLIMCYSFTSFDGILYGHLEPVIWVTTNHRFDCSSVILWFSDDERQIGFLDLVVVDEFLEVPQ